MQPFLRYILIAGALAGTLALIKDVSVISKLSIVGPQQADGPASCSANVFGCWAP